MGRWLKNTILGAIFCLPQHQVKQAHSGIVLRLAIGIEHNGMQPQSMATLGIGQSDIVHQCNVLVALKDLDAQVAHFGQRRLGDSASWHVAVAGHLDREHSVGNAVGFERVFDQLDCECGAMAQFQLLLLLSPMVCDDPIHKHW
jgi:hypothetical protein